MFFGAINRSILRLGSRDSGDSTNAWKEQSEMLIIELNKKPSCVPRGSAALNPFTGVFVGGRLEVTQRSP